MIARRVRALATAAPCPERLAEHMSREGGGLDGCSLRRKLLVHQSRLPAWGERVYMLTWPLLGAWWSILFYSQAFFGIWQGFGPNFSGFGSSALPRWSDPNHSLSAFHPSLSNSKVSPASETLFWKCNRVSLCFVKEIPGQAQGRTTEIIVY